MIQFSVNHRAVPYVLCPASQPGENCWDGRKMHKYEMKEDETYKMEVCIIREFPWVPWDSHGNAQHTLNSWEWEWEWWTGNGREFPLVTPITFLVFFTARAMLALQALY